MPSKKQEPAIESGKENPAQTDASDMPQPREIHRKEFGRRLATLIDQRGWNQSELARRAQIGRDRVSSYINGRTVPTTSSLETLAEALGMTARDLMSDEALARIHEGKPAPSVSVEQLQDEPGLYRLRLDKKISSAQMLKIMQLLEEDNT